MSKDARVAGTEDTETLADSIGGCFSNVMDLPEWMQVQALGRSMRPLTLIAARAVLESSWLAARDERVAAYERGKLAGMREALRVSMLARRITDCRDTYTDGYASGLCTAIEHIDRLQRLAELEAR